MGRGAALVAVAVGVSQRDSGLAREFGGWVRARRHAADADARRRSAGSSCPRAGGCSSARASGLWVVERSGKRTAASAPWQDATWSPRGLYRRRRDAAARSPPSTRTTAPSAGSCAGPSASSLPRWAPDDGFHVAYRSGHTLRIVYGNGEHDVKAGDRMANVAPAWRPSADRTLAWAATDGTVTVEDALTAKVLWTFGSAGSASAQPRVVGRRPPAADRRPPHVHDPRPRHRRARRHPPPGRQPRCSPPPSRPTGNRLALAVYADGQTEVRVQGETVLRGAGQLTDLEWSPDGRWLLAGWPSADHWLLVRASARARDAAVSGVRHRFGTTARTHGWCC